MNIDRPKTMRAFHSQLNSLGLMEDKAAIIKEFTNNRTGSARELTDKELAQLLQGLSVGTVKPPGDNMRKAIISMAHEMGWRKAGRIDMVAVNTWCVNKGKYHKMLNTHNLAELTELVTQFKIVYEKHLKTV